MIGFSADLVLKSSNKIYIFISFPKSLIFSHFSPVQCCPEKEILMQNVWSWYLLERFYEWCTTLSTLRYFKVYYYYY